MMKVITGTAYNLLNGKTIIHNEQTDCFSSGDVVIFEGEKYEIKNVIPPCRPNGMWSLCVHPY